ncbi:MAG TPA: NAD(P)-dependent oxidoreductase [Vicinamibacteria bacterium]|nr:NAD(P)-dependent oxidoreductase [Vicinamibacteria bacterium]
MRIFLAGGTGALGRSLIPRLARGGHHVVATTRNRERFEMLRGLGAEPVVMEGLDRQAVVNAVRSAAPEVIVHQMTALINLRNFKKFDEEFALTNRLRMEGTEHLLEAAQAVKARRVVAQSYTGGWTSSGEGSRLQTEDEPLAPNPPRGMERTRDAIAQLETLVTRVPNIESLVLRYGGFYGPGTFLDRGAEVVEQIRRRRFPIFGDGRGAWSFVHIDDAAEAMRLAIEGNQTGIYNIVDDDPAGIAVWLPELAKVLGAPRPFHLPAWLGRMLFR